MSSIAADTKPFPIQYQPGHPAADDKGNVKLPNVDPLMEAMDMRDAQRAYEANLKRHRHRQGDADQPDPAVVEIGG